MKFNEYYENLNPEIKEYFKIIYLNIWGFKLTFNEQKKLKIDPNSKKEL